ncbi:endodeoxyribonuclease [Mortierella sp. AD011]|nr:endodeoxyribonuclease [Mortierella sp. AD010]KAF9381014.1 endodeoxyribonuclease [Mortierella sp. AD011]
MNRRQKPESSDDDHRHSISSDLEIGDFDHIYWSDKSSLESSLSAYLGSTGSDDNVAFPELEEDQDIDLFLYSDEVQDCEVQQRQKPDEQRPYSDERGISVCEFNSSEHLNSECDSIQEMMSSRSSSIVNVFDGHEREGSDQSESSIELDEIMASDGDDDASSEDFPLIPSSDWGFFEDINNHTPVADSHQEISFMSLPSPPPSMSLSSLSSPSSPYMTTTPRSREWVLENLESLASQLLRDLSLGRAPTVELANRSSLEAITYDEENGVIRRKQDFSLFPADREAIESNREPREDDGGVTLYGGLKRNEGHVLGSSSGTGLYTKTHRWASIPSLVRTIDLIHENVCKNTVSSKRDLYYRDVMLFGSQPAVDNIVEDLACTLKVPRSCLNVVAGSRSVVYGTVRMAIKVRGAKAVKEDSTFEMLDAQVSQEVPESQEASEPNSTFPFVSQNVESEIGVVEHEDGDSLNRGFSQTDYNMLVAVPATMDDILEIEIHHKTRFVLVIEKEATMDNLISLGFCETHGPCILLTSKGYPDRVARQLLKLLSDMIQSGVFKLSRLGSGDVSLTDALPSFHDMLESTLQPPLNIPLLALVDCDPHGIEIYLNYRCGSIRSAYDNANLAVPTLQCLGQVPNDWNFQFNRLVTAGHKSCSAGGHDIQQDITAERDWDRFERALVPLTAKDRSKLMKLLTLHPYIRQHKEWKRQISRMLMMNRKSELQSLCLGETSPFLNSVTGGEGKDASIEQDDSHAFLVLYIERKLRDPELWL